MNIANLVYLTFAIGFYLYVRGSAVQATALEGGVTSCYGQIGIRYDPAAHKILRVHLYSPAHLAGLLPGDVVLAVDGDTHHRDHIDGPAGTEVVLRRGKTQFSVTITRIPAQEITKEYLRVDKTPLSQPVDYQEFDTILSA